MGSKKELIGFLLAGIVLLPGCIKVPTYRKTSLDAFNFSKDECYENTQEGVTVRVNQLINPKAQYFFDGHLLAGNDTEIIYLSIYNLSEHDYIVSPDDISLLQLPYPDINRLMKKTSTISRFSGLITTGAVVSSPYFFFTTLPFGSGAAGGLALLVSAGAAVVAVPFALAFLAQGIKSCVMNKRLATDIQQKVLLNKVVINSGDCYKGLIFVKKSDFNSDFTLTLCNDLDKKNKLTFDVSCA